LDLEGLNDVCLDPCEADLPISRYPFPTGSGVGDADISDMGVDTYAPSPGVNWPIGLDSVGTSLIFLDTFAAFDG
jgi:hypothetical protein